MDSTLDRLRERALALVGKLGWLPPTLARLTVGVVFAQTGWGKLHNLAKVTAFFTDLKIPAPHFNAQLVATTELVGGLLLLVGLLTRLAALPLIVSMTVAIVTAKRGELTGLGDFLGLEEWTYVLLFLWIAIAGPGPLSLDNLFGWLRKRRLSPSRTSKASYEAPRG